MAIMNAVTSVPRFRTGNNECGPKVYQDLGSSNNRPKENGVNLVNFGCIWQRLL